MKALNLRQNLLATADFVQGLQSKGVLEDLELRDNQLTEVKPRHRHAYVAGWH
jgi:crotonobetainyl-CoA:carnitine CoA-transferase CaiB-like acyl-CoA transferase